VAAGVAAIAIVALQQRAVAPPLQPGTALTALNIAPAPRVAPGIATPGAAMQPPREAISYTVPATSLTAPAAMAPARLTNYVLAHSRYSSGLDQRGVLADLLIEADEQQPVVSEAAAHVAP
jgi:hypothetical protein